MTNYNNLDEALSRAAAMLRESRHAIAFTGAGISVESGIPPFRGPGGLWNKYDPAKMEIRYFRRHPGECWQILKEVFYNYFGNAQANDAHKRLAQLEKEGIIKAVVTQNVDNLHQEAGSREVYEFHGSSARLRCLLCDTPYPAEDISLQNLPPRCPQCNGILKPDFIFFGEDIPRDVSVQSYYHARQADLVLVIGSTGEVMPACEIPLTAKNNGAKLLEINLEKSNFTSAADIYLQGKATEIMNRIYTAITHKTGDPA